MACLLAIILLCTSLSLLFNKNEHQVQSFVHPGLLHSRSDLDRMRDQQNVEPWKTAMTNLRNKRTSSLNYNIPGYWNTVSRKPDWKNVEFDNDMQAAWDQAVLWYITGNNAYKEKSKFIMTSRISALHGIGGTDAALLAGDTAIKLCNAAEIIRSFDNDWANSADFIAIKQKLMNLFYPLVEVVGDAGWGGSAMKTTISIAVLCDNQTLYDKTVDAFKNAPCASVTRYINQDGQTAEAGRDQGHPAGALGCLANIATVAWNQGLDLFSYEDNRLLKGFEYYARYNLGGIVPFTDNWGTCHATYRRITGRDPKNWLLVDAIYSHYAITKGLEAPYSQIYRDLLVPLGDLTLHYRNVESPTSIGQKINFPSVSKIYLGDLEFNPGARADSNLTVYYTTSAPWIITFNQYNKIIPLHIGAAHITAFQPGNAIYSAAPRVEQVIYVAVNPYKRIEAENYNTMFGIQKEAAYDVDGDLNICYTDLDDWISFEKLDFDAVTHGNNVMMIYFRYATINSDPIPIELRLGSTNGTLLGTCSLPSTNGWFTWKTDGCEIKAVTGEQNVFLIFKGRVNINWFQFSVLPNDKILSGAVDPYRRIEAENYNTMFGIQRHPVNDMDGYHKIGHIKSGYWSSYEKLDFDAVTHGNNIMMIYFRYTTITPNSVPIEIRLGSTNGTLLGTCSLPSTNSWNVWKTDGCEITAVTGEQNIVLVYGDPVDINWFQFAIIPRIQIR